jgi:DNA end-binding protein Ku
LPEPEENDESPSARPFWSGAITFGLVSVPVALYSATRANPVSLRMLSPKGTPLKRRYYSQESGKDLPDESIVRGYEIRKNKFIVVTGEELERLAPEKSREIDLRLFVKEADIPRMYFERGYFLAPAGGSVKAYRLLAETMQKTGRAGIATFVMRGKEYLIAILSDHGYLRAETMRFAEEVQTPSDIGLPEPVKPVKKAVTQFAREIEAHSYDDVPKGELRDRRAERLLALIEKKRKKGTDVVGARRGSAKEQPDVIDILTLLQKRLGQTSKTAKKVAKTHRKAA